MDDVVDDLATIAQRCERAGNLFEKEPLKSQVKQLDKACNEVGKSWSQSQMGYHAHVYLEDFRTPCGQENFDPTGSYGNVGKWYVVQYEEVHKEILKCSGLNNTNIIEESARRTVRDFDHSKADVLPLLDALIFALNDNVVQKVRDEIADLRSTVDQTEIIRHFTRPRRFISRDYRAIQEGVKVPHHLMFNCWLVSETSCYPNILKLAEKVRHVQRYIEAKHKMKGKSIARTQGKIAIGHGRSTEWWQLKTYLQDRLNLEVDEFNQQAVAGLAITDRLEQMLDDACFAFIVLTAEDEHLDGSQHARENVIHEVGLFQGRLGFKGQSDDFTAMWRLLGRDRRLDR